MIKLLHPHKDKPKYIKVYFSNPQNANIKVNGEFMVKDGTPLVHLIEDIEGVFHFRVSLSRPHNVIQAWNDEEHMPCISLFGDRIYTRHVEQPDLIRNSFTTSPRIYLPKILLDNNPTPHLFHNSWVVSSTFNDGLALLSGKGSEHDFYVRWYSEYRVDSVVVSEKHVLAQIGSSVYWIPIEAALSNFNGDSIEKSWNEIMFGGNFKVAMSEDTIVFWDSIKLIGVKSFHTSNPRYMLWSVDDIGEEIESLYLVSDIAIVNNSYALDVCYPKICQIKL